MKNIHSDFLRIVILFFAFFSTAHASVALPTNNFSNGDFELGGFSGWNVVSGTAFSDTDITSQDQYWGGAFNHQGAFHLWGFNGGGDSDIGVITSGRFVVGGDAILSFKIGGGSNVDDQITMSSIMMCIGMHQPMWAKSSILRLLMLQVVHSIISI